VIQLDSFDATRLRDARDIVRDLGSVLVAYSGGVDSTLLLRLAMDELGDGAVAVLASSPAYPESEQSAARELAASMGARLVEVTTDEVERGLRAEQSRPLLPLQRGAVRHPGARSERAGSRASRLRGDRR